MSKKICIGPLGWNDEIFTEIGKNEYDVILKYEDDFEDTVDSLLELIEENCVIFCFSYGGIILNRAISKNSNVEFLLKKVYYYDALVFEKVDVLKVGRIDKYYDEKSIFKDFLSPDEINDSNKKKIILSQFKKDKSVFHHHMSNEVFKEYLSMANEYIEPLSFSYPVKIYSSKKISANIVFEKIPPEHHMMMIERRETLRKDLDELG